VTAATLAGEPITAKLTRAPGNDAPIGGFEGRRRQRLVSRPGRRHREHLQDLRRELQDERHLQAIVAEAQQIVNGALSR